jgi:hypothetical protein
MAGGGGMKSGEEKPYDNSPRSIIMVREIEKKKRAKMGDRLVEAVLSTMVSVSILMCILVIWYLLFLPVALNQLAVSYLTAIVTAVMALAISLQVIALWTQSKATSDLVRLTIKEKKRERMLEIILKVIKPLIVHFTYEINRLDRNEFDWNYSKRHSVDTPEFIKLIIKDEVGEEYLIYGNFVREFPSMEKKIEERNSIYKELMESLNLLAGYVHDKSDFENQCIKKFEEFWEKHAHGLSDISMFGGEQRDLVVRELPNAILTGIIDNRMEIRSDGLTINYFWAEYRKDFLKLRDENAPEGMIEKINTIAKKLKAVAEELLKDLEDIKNELSDEYNFTAREIS